MLCLGVCYAVAPSPAIIRNTLGMFNDSDAFLQSATQKALCSGTVSHARNGLDPRVQSQRAVYDSIRPK